MQAWAQWQAEVIAILSDEMGEVLDSASLADVDWVAWYGFYLEGRPPRGAVDRAYHLSCERGASVSQDNQTSM